MSIVHLHDWRFEEDGDVEAGIAAIREYVDDLRETAPGLQLTLWLRDREDEKRFFHVAVYESLDALEAASASPATERFVDRLYPEIDRATHEYPTCDVVLSSWRGIDADGGAS